MRLRAGIPWVPAVVLALGVGVALTTGCASDVAGQSSAARASDEGKAANAAALVRVSTPEPVADAESYTSSLYVERDVWVTLRSTGIIRQVLVDRGARVREGQPLVQLETDLQEVDVRIAEQALRYHEAEYERSRSLHEENIVSAIDALRDEIERDLAASELDLARAKLDRCTLRAPFDGVVVEVLAVPGQRVSEDDETRLLRVVAGDRLRAKLHVPESRLTGLQLGGRATMSAPSEPAAEAVSARIVFVSPTVDAASGTALVIVEADPGQATPRNGSAVDVRLDAGSSPTPALFRVPRQALGGSRLLEGGEATLLVAASGRAVARRVDLVRLDGAQATVRGELRPDDRVIVDRASSLAAGDAVEVQEGGR